MISVTTPCPSSNLPLVWEWLSHFSKETLDTNSPKSLIDFLESEEPCRENGGKTFSIHSDGVMVGAIWVENIGDGIGVGHLVFDPGHTISTSEKIQASKLVMREVFKSFRKVMWAFFADNRAFRIFLKRMGAIEEGVFHQHVRRGPDFVDQAWMASFPETQ